MIFVQFWSAEDRYIQAGHMHIIPRVGEEIYLVNKDGIYKVIRVAHDLYTEDHRVRVYLQKSGG